MMDEQQPAKRTLANIAGKALMVLVPLAIGLGFGYFHLQIRQQIRDQETVAQLGIAVNAKIEQIGLRTIRAPHSSGNKAATGSREVCQATFRYSPPNGNAVITKSLLAAPLDLCKRYKAGDSTKAWVVPADNRIFMLEGDRISPWWSWVSLFLFMGLCGIAIVMLRSVLRIRRRQFSRR